MSHVVLVTIAQFYPGNREDCELWCWRRHLRVPWTGRRSILKEISPGYSLEGLMLKLKLQYFDYLMRRTDSLEKTLINLIYPKVTYVNFPQILAYYIIWRMKSLVWERGALEFKGIICINFIGSYQICIN